MYPIRLLKFRRLPLAGAAQPTATPGANLNINPMAAAGSLNFASQQSGGGGGAGKTMVNQEVLNLSPTGAASKVGVGQLILPGAGLNLGK